MKRRFRATTMFCIIVFFINFMTSCQGDSLPFLLDKQDTHTMGQVSSGDFEENAKVFKGGTLNVFSTYPDTLDPILTQNPYMQQYFNFIFESMIKLGKDQKPIPNLCDKWFVSEDGYTWTFHINEGVVWQDGFPFTAEDIKFTIEKINSSDANTRYSPNVENISAVKVVDRNTIEFTLKKPDAFLAESMTFPIISSRFYSKANNDVEPFDKNFPPGTGPYSFTSYEKEQSILLTSSKSWWQRKTQEKLETPFIPEICIKFFKNKRQAFTAFQAGSIDLIGVIDDNIEMYTRKTDAITKKYANGKWDFISLNLTNEILSDKYLRQFISLCIDKSEIVEELLPGRAIESNFPLIPGTWLHEFEEWASSLSNNKEDLQDLKLKSKENLLENGWEEHENKLYKVTNGVLTPVNLKILVNEENPIRIKIAEKITESLNSQGLTVTLQIEKWDKMLGLINSKFYDLAILGYAITDYPDFSSIYSVPHIDYDRFAKILDYEVATNISGFNNQKVDQIIDNIYKSSDESLIKKSYYELKSIFNDETPYIGLFFYLDTFFYNKKLRGNIDPYLWNEYNNITEWYISESNEGDN